MGATARTVFLQLKSVWGIPTIFFRSVVPFFALSAFHRHYRAVAFFTRHNFFLEAINSMNNSLNLNGPPNHSGGPPYSLNIFTDF
jgi:hypothetical protein